LNFGNPEKPDRFWYFKNCIEGIIDACTFLTLPVISGNVSFYNESPDGAILPTPTIGMVGVLEDISHATTQYFKGTGDCIILLGVTRDELGASQYLKILHSVTAGTVPSLDLAAEKALQKTVLALIVKKLIRSAHDCSEGGLAVCLAECCISNPEMPIGAVIDKLKFDFRIDAVLFSESQSRIVVSCKEHEATSVLKLAQKYTVPAEVIGKTGGNRFTIMQQEKNIIDVSCAKLATIWKNALPQALAND